MISAQVGFHSCSLPYGSCVWDLALLQTVPLEIVLLSLIKAVGVPLDRVVQSCGLGYFKECGFCSGVPGPERKDKGFWTAIFNEKCAFMKKYNIRFNLIQISLELLVSVETLLSWKLSDLFFLILLFQISNFVWRGCKYFGLCGMEILASAY